MFFSHFFLPTKFYGTEVRALWWPLQYFEFVAVKSFYHKLRSVLVVFVHLVGSIVLKLSTSCLMSTDVSMFPHTFLSTWCYIFFGVSKSLLLQSGHTTRCYHPMCFCVWWLADLLVFLKITMIIITKNVVKQREIEFEGGP